MSSDSTSAKAEHDVSARALTARSEKEKMAGVRETEREIQEENAARLREADKHLK